MYRYLDCGVWKTKVSVLLKLDGQQKTKMSLTFGMTIYVLKMDTINCQYPGRRMSQTTINNYDVASSRLRSLNATLTKSGKLDDYDSAVQMLLQKDHADVIPKDACVNPRTWFYPTVM